MNNKYYIGMLIGFVVLILAMPLGELYGNVYIQIGSGMITEQYVMLMERAIVSFQIAGALIAALSGLALIFAGKKQ